MTHDTFDEEALLQCNCRAIRRAARLVTNLYDEALAPTGLRATQFTLMGAVRLNESLSVNALAEILDLDRTTTGKNVVPLERLGYIDVKQSPSDSRSKVLTLTKAGNAILDQAYLLWQRAQATFEKANGKKNTAALREALSILK